MPCYPRRIAAAIYAWVESDQVAGEAGQRRRLTADEWRTRARRLAIPTDTPIPDLVALADWCHRAVSAERVAGLARSLEVSVEALSAVRIEWSGIT